MQDKRKTVLIAADVPYSRRLMQKTLQEPNLTVRAVGTTEEAIALVATNRVDALLIDLVNPPNAGEHLLLQCRVAGHRVPAILMCAAIDRDLLRRLNNLRPVGLLQKPLQFDALNELLPLALAGDLDLLRRSAEMAANRSKRERRTGPESAVGLTEVSDEPVNTDRLGKMFGNLPLLPTVLTQILAVSDSDEGSAQALADIISSDPRLSGQLLRVVNSAYFGFARRISTIPEATVILGSEAIRKLAVGASVSDFFSGKSQFLDRGRLWRHSLSTAVASRTVAEYRDLKESEEAFAAGLLHDFGRLILERHFPQQYGAVVMAARESQEPLLAAEEQMLGFHHAWISGWLAGRWNLPPALADAMAWHHQPESAGESARHVAAAVHVGDVLCHMAGFHGVDEVALNTTASLYATGVLDLNDADLEAMLPKVAKQAEELERQLASVVNTE
ncbi:MAG: HDOD domain-containing protein [Armatimonadetes bacterium]|nr:HDOD domain-containing protein [Armatimonadota bacterium]